MTVKIVSHEKGNPPGKLADAELHFTEGPARGVEADRLRGVGAEERQRPQRHVPGADVTRSTASGDRSRCCARLVDSTAQNRLRDLILEAYAEHAGAVAAATV